MLKLGIIGLILGGSWMGSPRGILIFSLESYVCDKVN